MNQIFIFLGIAAVGNAIYHLGQKTLSSSANPMLLLMAVYAVALVLAAAAAPFFQAASGVSWKAQVFSWPVLVLGAGVLLIEIGFLLAYRVGGGLQWSGVAVNAVSALLLLPIAVLLFGERFSPTKALGLLFTLVGMALLTRR
jgi:drug/metabolite transporter (DMT)-like permease